jgi:glycosyltransferase involved in cell wall biosynthesis
VVATVHDVLPYTFRHDPELGTLRHPFDALFYRLALRGLRRADAVLADSCYTAGEVARAADLADAAIRVVPLGVDAGRFRPIAPSRELFDRYGLSPDERYVVYVGSEDPRKNLPALLRAFAIVAASRPELRFLKVGPPHHADRRLELVRQADELRIADRVRLLDHVPDEELPALYGASAVCAVPSLGEGFGLPVLEAMACGVPVVASNRTSLPEVTADAALLVEPEPARLAQAISRLLDHPELAAELRERGLRQAARFPWRRTAELTAEAYDDVMRRPRP